MHIDVALLGGGAVLSGSLNGRRVLNVLLEQTAQDFPKPELVFLDFRDVQVATASFLRESVVTYRNLVRGRSPSHYPVIANPNDDVRDELGVLAKSYGDTFMLCTLTVDNVIGGVTVLGELNPKQKVTFDLVQLHGEIDARELMHYYGEREGVSQATAWNNRLSSLAALGLIVEISSGRSKRYRPLFAGD